MKDNLKDIKEDKEYLCKIRLELAKRRKSKAWNIKDLEAVLKYLKKDKSRDPNDHINEIFHSDVAGTDIKKQYWP